MYVLLLDTAGYDDDDDDDAFDETLTRRHDASFVQTIHFICSQTSVI